MAARARRRRGDRGSGAAMRRLVETVPVGGVPDARGDGTAVYCDAPDQAERDRRAVAGHNPADPCSTERDCSQCIVEAPRVKTLAAAQ